MTSALEQAEHMAVEQTIQRFVLISKLTGITFMMLMPLVMWAFPFFQFGHQTAIAAELAGIFVFSGALLAGSWTQLKQWWRSTTTSSTLA